MIVPPRGMMPAIRRRSSSTCFPGGSKPSKPSRKPSTSQPSFSAARTTPRRTAFKPGQSPPLVNTPIRGLVMCANEKSERFFWIDHPAAGSPLIVKLPAAGQELPAFGETIRAAEHHDDQISRSHFRARTVLLDFGVAMGGKNEAISGARRLAGLDAVDAVRAEELIRIAQQVSFLLVAAIERDLPFLLRDIKTERRFVHRVTGQPGEIGRGGERHRLYVGVDAVRV